MTRPDLKVILYGRHVADVLDTGFGDTAVRYTRDANDHPTTSRLSLALPVQEAVHITHGPGGRWVRSLLPEGRALAWAVEHFGIAEDDRFGLISVLGVDVAGAVQILTDDEQPLGHGTYEVLDDTELGGLMQRAPNQGLGLDRERGVRLSLAGMQDKLLLYSDHGHYYLPINGAPSTLIVKPQPAPERNVDGLVTNELFCLTLARLVGLDVALAYAAPLGGTPALIVHRFDRQHRNDGTVERIHQEDLLGALGMDPLLKYEYAQVVRSTGVGGFAERTVYNSRPGPSLADLAQLLTTHLGRGRVAAFLEAVTFNIAIGNADAHARNYSLLFSPSGAVSLAPLYDLVSTTMWDHLDREPAQRVSGIDDLDEIRLEHLVQEARSWSMPETFSRRRIIGVLERVAAAAGAARDECVTLGGDPAVADVMSRLIVARVAAINAG